MEGLRGAATAVQAAEFARVHERLLDQPGSTPVEVMQELKQAAKVIPLKLCSLYHCVLDRQLQWSQTVLRTLEIKHYALD